MPIRFRCSCGQAMKVGDEWAGKKAKCPTCKKVLSVPAESTEGSTVLVPGGAAATKTSKTAKSANEYAELGLEAPPAVAAKGTKCPGCGKQLSAGARICITCGFDLQTGQAHATSAGRKEKERVIASTDERAPWFTLMGIEFSTMKLIVVAVLMVGVLGFIFGIVLPAKAAMEDYTKITKGLEPPLLTEINKQLDDHGPPQTHVNGIMFHEPFYMLSVPQVLEFECFITGDDINTATFDVMRGTYDQKSGELKLNMPNKNDSGATGRVDVVAVVTPGQVAAAGGPGKPAIPDRPKNPKERTMLPEVRDGAKFWELGAPADYTWHAKIEPWPLKAGETCIITITGSIDDYERTWFGQAWYRMEKLDGGGRFFMDWVQLKQLNEPKGEEEAKFEFSTRFAPGKYSIQFKIARIADFVNEKHVVLTDWELEIPKNPDEPEEK